MEAARLRLATSRNARCPCGSGRKYKRCCLESDQRLVREASAQPGEGTGVASPSDLSPDPIECLPEAFEDEADPAIPPEVQRRVDAVWQAFEAVESPSVNQMDAFLDGLLALPAEASNWNEVFDLLEAHPDLPRVFRRIVDTVPPTVETRLSFFYWNVAEAFTRRGYGSLLPEVAAELRRLDGDTYDADAVYKVADFLLAEGYETETLDLAEHFLPIMRADERLMPYAVPELCVLIFELRVGVSLRSPGPETNAAPLAGKLLRGLEDDLHAGTARLAADALLDPTPALEWTRAAFELPPDDGGRESDEMDGASRLTAKLIAVAREVWQIEGRPPGCTFRGLLLVWTAVSEEIARKPKRRKRPSSNLLDYLAPAGMEERLVRACPEIMGINVPRARLLLDAQEALLHFAQRHELISAPDASRTAKELRRLNRAIQRVD